MTNITSITGAPRSPIALSARILPSRLRRNQEPAASQAEMERSAEVLSATEVSQTLTETWGWS